MMAGRLLRGGVLCVVASLAATAAAAQADDCMISLDAIAQPIPRFSDYPAPVEAIGRPAAPVLAGNREARRFASQIRDQARTGPNFAGHLTVVGWGCGTACLQWAVVDAKTGAVRFEPSIEVVTADRVSDAQAAAGDANQDFFMLRFRRDSRLMIVLGAPKEDEARGGAAFYEWTGASFKLVKFVPRKQACRAGG